MGINALNVPVSVGEVIDKITILEIKSERIGEEAKLVNVRRELLVLNRAVSRTGIDLTLVTDLKSELKAVNERLWEIEDAIRIKESLSQFDNSFIELARSVYRENDQRAEIKGKINFRLGSDLVEEKSYVDYRPSAAR